MGKDADRFQRSIDQLRERAAMFWPEELSKQEAELSVIPKLLETQDQFIAILSVPVADLDKLFMVVDASALPGNLFLKHLVVLADFGGEMLQRVNRQFRKIFPDGVMQFVCNGATCRYEFAALPIRRHLNNASLGISGKTLLAPQGLTELHRDVAAILIFGSASTDEGAALILQKGEVGNYMGDPAKLEKFIKQRYIWVSRITRGSAANNLGQIAQEFVKSYIQKGVSLKGVTVTSNHTIRGVKHTGRRSKRGTNFDIVVQRGKRNIAVEVSFQVTTNSTIERKAGQARSRFQQIERAGHKIAYVVDGAGNFQRENAIGTICDHSHCTVAFTRSELDVLCDFLRQNLQDAVP